MAELDLTDPEHLADVLRATLPGFTAETPSAVQPHIHALASSDADAFSHVGTGARADTDSDPVESPDDPVEPPDAGLGPAGPLPLDLGGDGDLIDEARDAEAPGETEIGGLPIRARRGWNEIDRHRSKGRHEVYELEARHARSRPIKAGFTGRCQSVRVRLPCSKPSADAFIGTWIGPVEAKDHLLFSIEEVAEVYARDQGERPALKRVDLITGARFRGRRFSPVSVYLAYASSAADATPIFYLLEGGSASGKPQSLYVSRTMDSSIHAQADFEFTPFARHHNWYDGGLAMSEDLSAPTCVYLSVALSGASGAAEHLQISVSYTRDRRLRRVIHPFEVQIEAAMRIMALADEMGCQLKTGAGGVLQHSLGPIARASMSWDPRPTGTTTPAQRAAHCGGRDR